MKNLQIALAVLIAIVFMMMDSTSANAFDIEMGFHSGALSSGKAFVSPSLGVSLGRWNQWSVGCNWKIFKMFGEAFSASMEIGRRWKLGKQDFIMIFALPTLVGEQEIMSGPFDTPTGKVPTSWNFSQGAGIEVGRGFSGIKGLVDTWVSFRVECLPRAFKETTTLGKRSRVSDLNFGVRFTFHNCK